jgi:hypothetical protein
MGERKKHETRQRISNVATVMFFDERGGSAKKATATILALVDRGFTAVQGMTVS